ncbi:MAG TPA: zf-HC2 domain-containing protein [Blastocatellia bacterium]|nr:zf-HC2 domain-containing protein [Blastocatellia bacterium]
MIFNPDFSCGDVRRLFPGLMDGSLDAVVRGRLKGHLLSCRACAIAFDMAVSEAADSGAVLLGKPSSTPPLPASILEAAGVRDRSGNIVWTRLLALDARGVVWAKQLRANIGLLLVLALERWAASRIKHRSVQDVGSGSTIKASGVDADVVDSAGRHKGASIKLKFVKPPTISAGGELTLILQTGGTSLHGRMLSCAIEISERCLVSFEGKLQEETEGLRWQAVIGTDVISYEKGIEYVVVPWEKVRLTLQEDEQ